MKLSEYKDEDALDLLADLIEPATKIFQNQELANAVRAGKTQLQIAKIAIKANKAEVMEILAIVNGKESKDYHCTVFSILKDFMELMNDEELIGFFTSQGLMEEQTSSTSSLENTEVKGH